MPSSSTSVSEASTRPRPRALLVGISYPDTDAQLYGCGNDVRNLLSFAFTEAGGTDQVDVRLLTDDEDAAAKAESDDLLPVHDKPTRQAILDGIAWLVADATSDSRLWFSYSGHGSWLQDRGGDETDNRDEALVPSDYATAGVILDDELRTRLVDPLPRGARLTALIDACHSGTGLDLRFTVDDISVHQNGHHKERHVKTYVRDEWRRVQRTIMHKRTGECAADVLMFSGCRDQQTSADTVEDEQHTGALTYAFLRFMTNAQNRRADHTTPASLLQDMTVWLRVRRYTQRPVLSYGHPIDVDAPLQIFSTSQ